MALYTRTWVRDVTRWWTWVTDARTCYQVAMVGFHTNSSQLVNNRLGIKAQRACKIDQKLAGRLRFKIQHAEVLTYLLTYSMVQSPSWEANWFAASQEIPRISQNPKVHYRTHKRPPPVSILGQPNPVHIPTSHLLVIRPNNTFNVLQITLLLMLKSTFL